MVELADIQAAYYMVAATGVLVAAVFYILNLRVSQRNQELMLKAQQQTLENRRISTVQERMRYATNSEILKNFIEMSEYEWIDYEDFERKYDSDSNPEVWAKKWQLWSIWSSMGSMMRNGVINSA